MIQLRPGVDFGKACEQLKSMLDKSRNDIRIKSDSNEPPSHIYAINYGRLEGAIDVFLATCTDEVKDGAREVKKTWNS